MSSSIKGFEFVEIEIVDNKTEDGLSGGRRWDCTKCGLCFLNKAKHISHECSYLRQEPNVNCLYCNKPISSKEDGKDCYANKKCTTCEYKCSKCPQRFQRHSSLLNHEKRHDIVKNKPGSIKNSTPTVESKKVIRAPRKRHSQNVESMVKIESADNAAMPKRRRTVANILSEPSDLNTSKKQISQIEENVPKQIKQEKQDSSPNSFLSGSRNINGTYKPFSCQHCSANFSSTESLLQHVKLHGETTSKGFQCKHCDKEFEDIYKLQFHLAICPLAEDENDLSLAMSAKKRRAILNGSSQEQDSFQKSTIKVLKKLDSESSAPSLNVGVKKRNNFNYESPNMEPSSRQRRQKQLAGPQGSCSDMNDNTNHNTENNPLNHSAATIEEEEKRKSHCCPFPGCGMKFSREKALLCHMRNHSDDFADSYKCHKCDIPFEDIQSLRSHINICKDIKIEKEDNCSEPEFVEDEPLEKSFLPIRNRGAFTCKICGKTYVSEQRLQRCRHSSTKNTQRITCRICSLPFDNEKMLKKHFRATHPKDLPFKCAQCHVEYDTKEAAAQHFKTHLASEILECFICSRTLPTYQALYHHFEQDHRETKQSVCKICNTILPNEYLMELHSCPKLRVTLECKFCRKIFSTKGSLRTHLKMHTNEQSYKCKICYREFFDTNALIKHMMFHASMKSEKDQPYKCCICLHTCNRKINLTNHILVKHVANTLADLQLCPICDKITEDEQVMAFHIMEHSVRITRPKCRTSEEIKWLERRGSSALHDKLKKSEIQNEEEEEEMGLSNPSCESAVKRKVKTIQKLTELDFNFLEKKSTMKNLNTAKKESLCKTRKETLTKSTMRKRVSKSYDNGEQSNNSVSESDGNSLCSPKYKARKNVSVSKKDTGVIETISLNKQAGNSNSPINKLEPSTRKQQNYINQQDVLDTVTTSDIGSNELESVHDNKPTIEDEPTINIITGTQFYVPYVGLTEYSCTMCNLSFTTQDELARHSTYHVI